MSDLQPPRHISTLPVSGGWAATAALGQQETFLLPTANYLVRGSKHLDYATLSDASAGGVSDLAFKVGFELQQVLDPPFHLDKPRSRDVIDRFA
jgi:hypothetical protein